MALLSLSLFRKIESKYVLKLGNKLHVNVCIRDCWRKEEEDFWVMSSLPMFLHCSKTFFLNDSYYISRSRASFVRKLTLLTCCSLVHWIFIRTISLQTTIETNVTYCLRETFWLLNVVCADTFIAFICFDLCSTNKRVQA